MGMVLAKLRVAETMPSGLRREPYFHSQMSTPDQPLHQIT